MYCATLNTRAIFVNHHGSSWNKVEKIATLMSWGLHFFRTLLGYKVWHFNVWNGRFKDVLVLLFTMLSLSGIWVKQRMWNEWSCHCNFIIIAVANCTKVKLSGSVKFAFFYILITWHSNPNNNCLKNNFGVYFADLFDHIHVIHCYCLLGVSESL